MSQSFLKDRINQSQDYDRKFQTRTFGQSQESEVVISEQVDKERALIDLVKQKVNDAFGVRILTEEKQPEFKKLLRDAVTKILQSITESGESGAEYGITQLRSLTEKIVDEILGYGAIQNLIEDTNVTEIMVTRFNKIYIEQGGHLVLKPEIAFANEEQLRSVIEKIVAPIGRKIDESTPMVDARLPDGSRVNATIPPISPDGSTLTIRKFSKKKLTGEDYLRFGSLDPRMLEFLMAAVMARCNIIVSGGTGTGKTTLLNMLSNYIPAYESIVTVEDSCELILVQDNVRRLEARPENAEQKGAVTIRELVKNCLRMRPDRIVVGEIRGGEVVDMFRSMSSGHDGALTTLHSNSPKDLVDSTLPILFGMSDMKLSEEAQKKQICSAVDLIIQISRLRDGSRKITNICHVVGLGKSGASKLKIKTADPDKIYLQDIFKFVQTGMSSDGKVEGHYVATGYMPKEIIDKFNVEGIKIPLDIFAKDDLGENAVEEGESL